jgi:hypothetical protein
VGYSRSAHHIRASHCEIPRKSMTFGAKRLRRSSRNGWDLRNPRHPPPLPPLATPPRILYFDFDSRRARARLARSRFPKRRFTADIPPPSSLFRTSCHPACYAASPRLPRLGRCTLREAPLVKSARARAISPKRDPPELMIPEKRSNQRRYISGEKTRERERERGCAPPGER